MSTVKTKVDKEKVYSFLKNHYDEDVSDPEFIAGGEMSQAFSFKKSEEELIIRINKRANGFGKDKFAFEHFVSNNIPIPEIFEIGKFDDDYYYAISEKAKGKILKELSDEEYEKVFPELFSILNAIHNAEIPQTTGFGYWATDGVMETKTWKNYVLNVNKHVISTESKPSLFETSFLEKDFWEPVYKQMESFLEFCPEDKYLVHGDYGSDNAAADNGHITGIFDWDGSKYGDFLYDIAWLNFWSPKRNPLEFFIDYYTKEKPTSNFKERVLCYQLRIGLSSLSFYAFSNQKDKYDRAKTKIVSILETIKK